MAISRGVMGEVLRHIRGARRPLLPVGGVCVSCDEALLNELVEVLAMPVVYTAMGKVSSQICVCVGGGRALGVVWSAGALLMLVVLKRGEQPACYCGAMRTVLALMGTAGARGEGDEAQLNELVEVLAMPVVYTFMGKVSL